MKKNENIEMRIYELLGVKIFRRMAFILRDRIWILFNFKTPKEEIKEYLYHTASNYNLGKVESLEDVKKFKKQLFLNAGIHTFALLIIVPEFLEIIGGGASLSSIIIGLVGISINLYCIMLQRYNGIRINYLIKRMTPRYERQKDKIKEELRKEDSLLSEHTYKIVDKKRGEITITFEQLIADASLEQLKQYREHLVHFKDINSNIQDTNYYNDKMLDVSIPIEKNKLLRLELKPNKNNNLNMN